MTLTDEQQAMLDGRRGWPQQIAMRLLTAVARGFDADRLIPVASVHLSLSGVSVGPPGRTLFEQIVQRGGRFVVPTTLNVLSLDRRTAGRDATLADKEATQLAIARACESLGGIATYSCNPFLLGVLPARGESVAWNESATAPYVNSVLAARTNREGATALASALTGFTVRYGMHLDENRLGGVGIELAAGVEGADAFAVLGGAIGHACGARIPVIGGLRHAPTLDEYTAFCAALAAVSPVAMFHLAEITPEAPDSMQGLEIVHLGARELRAESARHTTASGDRVDIVAVGCPHASLEQIRAVADLVGARHVNPSTRFVVQTSAAIAAQADREGLVGRLIAAGVEVSGDTCVHIAYREAPAGATLATNSLKIAYLTGSHDVGVRFGPLEACVQAAIAGRWTAAPS